MSYPNPGPQRKFNSIMEGLERMNDDPYNLKSLEEAVTDILLPPEKRPQRPPLVKPPEPVMSGENFSFVRNQQEFIPGLEIEQEGEAKKSKDLKFLSDQPSTSGGTNQENPSSFPYSDVRYRDTGFSRANFHRFNRPDRRAEQATGLGGAARGSWYSDRGSSDRRNSFRGGSGTDVQSSHSYSTGQRYDFRGGRGDEGKSKGFGQRNFSRGGRQDDYRGGRGMERHYDNRGRGADGGRYYDNRGRGYHNPHGGGQRYYDQWGDRGGRGFQGGQVHGSPNSFPRGFGWGGRGSYDNRGGRSGGGERRGRPNRHRRRQLSAEEERDALERMIARDHEMENRLRVAGGQEPKPLSPPPSIPPFASPSDPKTDSNPDPGPSKEQEN